jgi:pimeloyl-ACP methyl ester carboxylesterase
MRLFFKESGQKDAETIIFLHAGGISGWMWDEQLDFFHKYHCIVPDLPEHGMSADVKPFTIDNAAELLVEIIKEHSNNQRAHLVGISLGSQIILQILSKAPEMVESAFISGTLIRDNNDDGVLLKLLDKTLKVYQPVKNSDFFIKANMRMYNMPKSFFKQFKQSIAMVSDDSLERILTENMKFNLPHGLEDLDVPVMVVVGEKDYRIIKKSAIKIVEEIPGSKSAMAFNVGHLWNLESPELFNQMLATWLSDREPPKDWISSIKN